ncbi:hypothetical protein HPB50_022328 [Hyalomma asiaticum]|uniref:Uncharacterized protein n=1 Tax=Hyalomma asiaticum TaxID=266040 RepID=A0ACB7T0S6_HYAAI|nr:hypothetical protein HPB50_022328 [Hyalomma asiaticum]
MDMSKLRKPDLVMLCEEMGTEVATLRRKPPLIQALEDTGADEEQLSECWELIQERMKRERETVRHADDYNKMKARLLKKKFRLSVEAFRRRFRGAQNKMGETFQEFAFNMKANLIEWLKGEGVYEDRDRVVDLICLEQFSGFLDEEMRLWIQDRPWKRNTERAAELPDEYTVRRLSEKARVRPFNKQPLKDRPERKGTIAVKNAPEKEAKENSEKEKNFEPKKPLLCFRCQEPGHIAAGCRKPKLVFSVRWWR